MSTPESKLQEAADKVSTEIASAKTWYERHLPLLALVAGLVIGWIVGHVHL
jgi:hypothetical protein